MLLKSYIETSIVSYLAAQPRRSKSRNTWMAVVRSLPVLAISDDARRLAAAILASTALTAKSAADALHIAIVTVNAMDFLLSWNCTHIANAIIYRHVSAISREIGYEPPVVCTPEELMEG